MVLRDDNFERLFWILREIARMAKQFFPPEIYGRIIFEFMESSLFMEMLTSSWRAVTKSHSFFPFFSLSLSLLFFLLSRNPEAFVEILLPNWPFHISKNIDSGNVRGEKSFVQSTHRGPASGISNSNFPAIELAGKRAVWSVPSSVETRHKVAAPIMNNSEHKFA